MGDCADMCKLGPDFESLSLKDQVSLLRICHQTDAANYGRCRIDKNRLEKWIKDH